MEILTTFGGRILPPRQLMTTLCWQTRRLSPSVGNCCPETVGHCYQKMPPCVGNVFQWIVALRWISFHEKNCDILWEYWLHVRLIISGNSMWDCWFFVCFKYLFEVILIPVSQLQLNGVVQDMMVKLWPCRRSRACGWGRVWVESPLLQESVWIVC